MHKNQQRSWCSKLALLVSLILGYAVESSAWQATLAWDANPSSENVVAYVVHFGTVSRFQQGFVAYEGQVDVGGATQTTVTLPREGTTYYLSVVARNSYGLLSDFSAEVVAVPAGSSLSYAIVASAGSNGSISPSGSVSVSGGGSQSFTVLPSAGYHVASVLVDGTSVGAVTSYRFSNVTTNHTIAATFAADAATGYTVTASAGANGAISPSGLVSVNSGASRSFTITPNSGYHVASVLVDGVSVGAVTGYTFNNVTANHTIAAAFAADVVTSYTLTASAGANGTISPSGPISVTRGANQNFAIAPNTGYHVASVLVDGVLVGAVTGYTFTNVTANHTIAVTFAVNTYTVTSSAGPNGTISPSGSVSVSSGASRSFTITPGAGYHVASVSVDGASAGAVTSYTFSNVTANHAISAQFEADAGLAITPVPYLPPSGAFVDTPTPTLQVQNPLVSDTLAYEFQVASDAAMTRVVASSSVSPGVGITSWIVPPSALVDKTRYYWRARVSRGGIAGNWTELSTFVFDATEAATTFESSGSGYLLASAESALEVTEATNQAAGVSVLVPAQAVGADSILTVGVVSSVPLPTGDVRLAGRVFSLGPYGVPLAKPATIKLPYSKDELAQLGVSGPEGLTVVAYETGSLSWRQIPVDAIDRTGSRLVCRMSRFSMVAIAATASSTGTGTTSTKSGGSGGGSGSGGLLEGKGGCFIGESADPASGSRGFLELALLLIVVSVLTRCARPKHLRASSSDTRRVE